MISPRADCAVQHQYLLAALRSTLRSFEGAERVAVESPGGR